MLLQQTLLGAGFKSINIDAHCNGKSMEQLDLSFIQRLEFNLKSWLAKEPIDRFMENIMVIAQK